MRAKEGQPLGRGEMFAAFAPYLIIIVVLGVISLNSVTKELTKATSDVQVAGAAHPRGHRQAAEERALQARLVHRGRHRPARLRAAQHVRAARVGPALALRTYVRTLDQIKWAL